MVKTDRIIPAVKDFISQQYVLILFSLIALIGLGLLAQIPYVNLVLTFENVAYIYWLLIILFFKPKISTSFLLAVILLTFAPILIILGFASIAEKVGNGIYFLLVVGCIQNVWLYLKSVKQSND